MSRLAQPSFALSRFGLVQPGEMRAGTDAGVPAWLARIEPAQRAADNANNGWQKTAGTVFAMAPAGAGSAWAA